MVQVLQRYGAFVVEVTDFVQQLQLWVECSTEETADGTKHVLNRHQVGCCEGREQAGGQQPCHGPSGEELLLADGLGAQVVAASCGATAAFKQVLQARDGL